MAAISTAAAGVWSSPGTWTGGVVPGDGDTVTINHAVTLDDARTVGHSPGAGDATAAIACNAALTIAATGVLTCRGDLTLAGNDFLVLQAGATLEFDASAATTPATALYVCGSSGFTNARILIQGTSGSRCTVRSNAGGANGRFTNPDVSEITADYCDFQRIGDADNAAWEGSVGDGQTMHFGHCTFDADCGAIGDPFSALAGDGSTVELLDVTHLGPSSVRLGADVFTEGTRTISGCRLAGDLVLYRCDGYDISDTVIEGFLDVTGGPWGSWERVLVAMPEGANDFAAQGPMSDMYVLRVGNPTNEHGFASTDDTVAFDGFIFDAPDSTDGAGDWITFGNPSAAKTIEVKNCLVLPNASGFGAGSLSSCLGGANLTVRATHNTYNSGLGVYVGETYAGHAGMLDECHSNLVWNATPASSIVIEADPGVVQDVVLSAKAHHNGKWNLIGTGYSTDLTFSSGVPGANDITGDPDFVDPTRNIKTWDASLGGAGTVASALTGLRNRSAGYVIADLITYVRAGFVVQNAPMRVGAADGTVMGAVQLAPPAPPGPSLRIRRLGLGPRTR